MAKGDALGAGKKRVAGDSFAGAETPPASKILKIEHGIGPVSSIFGLGGTETERMRIAMGTPSSLPCSNPEASLSSKTTSSDLQSKLDKEIQRSASTPCRSPHNMQPFGGAKASRLDADPHGPSAQCPEPSTAPPRNTSSEQPAAESSGCAKRKADGVELSVKELKEQLAGHGVDCIGCVEKADLQSLWDRFETLCQKSLEELQASVAAASPNSNSACRSAEACAAFLLNRPSDTGRHPQPAAQVPSPRPDPVARTPAPAPAAARAASCSDFDSPFDAAGSVDNSLSRDQEAAKEVSRIESLVSRRRYITNWEFAVLAVQTRDLASVQRAYRGLMKKLHPDKVQQTAAVAQAIETLKEAKDACERCLSKQQPPGAPKKLSFTPLCTVPGRRRYELHWQPPESRDLAPVQRYIVAALDPAYGKALTIAVLEPDYSEEKRRFVGIEELGTYILAEEELQKMPSLWRQSAATMQVAAANDAGQSSWSIVHVSLSASLPLARQLPQGSFASPRDHESRTPSGGLGASARDELRAFAEQVRIRSGEDLRTWLNRQVKGQLALFAKSKGWPDDGTKTLLVDRIVQRVALLRRG